MGLKAEFCLLCLVPVLAAIAGLDDAVVVEAEPSGGARSRRQIIIQVPTYQYSPQAAGVNVASLAPGGACITSKGLVGRCSSFRDCYPDPRQTGRTDLNGWFRGMFDACNYYTVQGRQLVGLCCMDPPKPAAEGGAPGPPVAGDNMTKSEAGAYYPPIPNWPPPLPTHPPHHTIPPLPTHPPSPGYPPSPTTTTTGRPTRPPKATTAPAAAPTIAPIAHNSCGTKNGYQDQERIVGGHNADVNEWPWIAALFNGGRQFCGGSLIDNIHILSAAHCVAHMSSWDVARLTVRLGDHNIKTNNEVQHIEKRVKRVVRHRGFDGRTLYNDIAILTLDSPVKFTQQIRPVCLPKSRDDFAGHTGTVVGWGSLRESGPQPAILQEVNIPIWTNRECRLKYGPAAPGGIVDHMLCAGQAARDSCSGDSGGPLMVNSGRWTQVGIVSWGIGCGKGQYPGVYTRVEKFLPWINKNLK